MDGGGWPAGRMFSWSSDLTVIYVDGWGVGKRVDARQNESYERVHRIMGVNRWRSASFARPFFFLSSPYQLSCINRSTRLTMSQPERDIVLENGRLLSKGQKGTQKWGHDNRKSSRGWSGMMMEGEGGEGHTEGVIIPIASFQFPPSARLPSDSQMSLFARTSRSIELYRHNSVILNHFLMVASIMFLN